MQNFFLQLTHISNNPLLPLSRIERIIIALQESFVKKHNDSAILLRADHAPRCLQHLVDARIAERIIKSGQSLFIVELL